MAYSCNRREYGRNRNALTRQATSCSARYPYVFPYSCKGCAQRTGASTGTPATLTACALVPANRAGESLSPPARPSSARSARAWDCERRGVGVGCSIRGAPPTTGHTAGRRSASSVLSADCSGNLSADGHGSHRRATRNPPADVGALTSRGERTEGQRAQASVAGTDPHDTDKNSHLRSSLE